MYRVTKSPSTISDKHAELIYMLFTHQQIHFLLNLEKFNL